MVLQIRGVAHPAPPADGSRREPADLTAAEVRATNIAGKPLLNEHDSNARVGTCLASWQGPDGSLRIAANVNDPKAIEDVRAGKLRGLSLGTDLILDEGGKVLYRGQQELSVCAEGRRPGTWVDTINGRTVLRHSRASRSQTLSGMPRPRYP